MLAVFLLKDASPAQLRQCFDHYDKVVKQNGHWETNDIHKCALGVWSNDIKELWESVQDDLKRQLHDYLRNLQSHYSTSIGYDNVYYNRGYDVQYLLHTKRESLSVPEILALKWRVSRKHLLELAINNLETAQLNPEAEKKRELNEVTSYNSY